MRIGILGGTFDPIHLGHIYLAEKVLKKLSLGKIIFIPAYLPPHKRGIKITPARHRYNMVKLGAGKKKNFSVSAMELRRKGRSYSVETLERLKQKYGRSSELFFITGSDSLRELSKWKNIKEVLNLCRFVVIKRPHFGIKNAEAGFILLDIGAKDISATNIRKRLAKELPISKLVPKAVDNYIAKNRLYAKELLKK